MDVVPWSLSFSLSFRFLRLDPGVFGASGIGDTSRGVAVLGGGGKVNMSVGGGGKNEAGGIGNLMVSRGEGPPDRGEGDGEGPDRGAKIGC